MNNDDLPKIYLWPNLMTAGNLCCGFFAVLSIFGGISDPLHGHSHYYQAIILILLSCVFDLLDGRMARLVGQDSPFGREFDSLADIVSFGMAPAMLVYGVVLQEFDDYFGWGIAFFYLLCGAMRLARFNCIAATDVKNASKDFVGFPIPAAAGVISSLTLLLLWVDEKEKTIGKWKYSLPFLMILLACMMFSTIKYPSFKGLNVRTKRSMISVLVAIMVVVVTVKFWRIMPALFFVTYLCYGPIRPWVSRKWQKELEADDESVEDEEPAEAPQPPQV